MGPGAEKGPDNKYREGALLLGPQDPAGPRMLKMSVEENIQSGAHGQPSCENHSVGSWNSGASSLLLQQSLMHLLKNGLEHVIGHGRNGMFDSGVSNDHTFRAAHCNLGSVGPGQSDSDIIIYL